MPLLDGQARLWGVASCGECGITRILWCSAPGKPRILRLLLMDVGLKVANVAIQIIGIVEYVILAVTEVMDIHISLGGAWSALWCMFGIKIRGSWQQKFLVGVVTNAFSMKCLQLVGLILDLPDLFLRMDGILEHVRLPLGTNMRCCVD